jgi:hypothetical protein
MDLGNIRPAMEVVGSDGEHLGAADHVDHNRTELRRNHPASGGEYQWLAQDSTMQPSVPPADRARQSWQGEAAAASPRRG